MTSYFSLARQTAAVLIVYKWHYTLRFYVKRVNLGSIDLVSQMKTLKIASYNKSTSNGICYARSRCNSIGYRYNCLTRLLNFKASFADKITLCIRYNTFVQD
jgi:hypothetical protein